MPCCRLPSSAKSIAVVNAIPTKRCQNKRTEQRPHLRQRRINSSMLEYMVALALSPLNSSYLLFHCFSVPISGHLNRHRSSSVTFPTQTCTHRKRWSGHPYCTRTLTNLLNWSKAEVSAFYTALARLILILSLSMDLEARR